MYKRVVGAYFSGTDTTKTVVNEIGKTLADKLNIEYKEIDFTPLSARENNLEFNNDDIVILGIFTVAGRVPNLMLPYLNTIKGNGAVGAAVSLYGNRNPDDCLVELQDLMENGEITVIGGGYFVGEHSFSDILGKNRPDKDDLNVAREFADKLYSILESGGELKTAKLPGERPYRAYYQPRDRHGVSIDIRKVKPKTNEKCTDCKLCVKLCPLGSIEFDDVSVVSGICMKCCACIKKCPEGAKYFDDEGYLYHKTELEEVYFERAKSEFFV